MGIEVESSDFELDLTSVYALAGGEPRQSEFTGTKALMLAVLEDGLRSYLSTAKSLALEAEQWVHSSRRRSPFSFVVVCETLNLNPEAVRRVLVKLRAAHALPKRVLPRARPNVRVGSRLLLRKRA